MVFKFMIISDEVDNFFREIQIDADATFLDLQNIILESVGYSKDQMTSFFLCDDEWNKQTEITLMEMDTSSDIDSYVMQDTHLEELLEDEKQKLIFVFDYMTERCFFMELRTIVPGENLKKAKCIRSSGDAPAQILSIEEFESKQGTLDLDEDFYGDSEYDINEIDKEGFSEGISDEESF
ncbi:MAG: hypothetical protein PUB21_01390 [Bacteroidales bacterium]|nr:hypothetical protein [Bacteroidales bacterium]